VPSNAVAGRFHDGPLAGKRLAVRELVAVAVELSARGCGAMKVCHRECATSSRCESVPPQLVLPHD
jgi:hypothetical protein